MELNRGQGRGGGAESGDKGTKEEIQMKGSNGEEREETRDDRHVERKRDEIPTKTVGEQGREKSWKLKSEEDFKFKSEMKETSGLGPRNKSGGATAREEGRGSSAGARGGAKRWGLARPLAGAGGSWRNAIRGPKPLGPGCVGASGVVPVPRGSREAGPRHPRELAAALPAPGEGAARCHFTCAQRVVRRSHGAGRGSRPLEREGAASGAGLERGRAGAASPGGPAVPTGPQHSTAALRAPPPAAPAPPPRLSAATSASSLPAWAISKAPSPRCPCPPPS
ncbi:brain acid soluble protein 1-like [Mustela erminea]|uniref:brain acid soluble protein 1-like n=1 Tax=Mustela erminea TaxID=36723 RepID=UPI00138672E5|nr:brain acid soluble protein 1-like [Mustela erminea]